MIDIREPEAKTALREQLSVSYHKNFWQEFATTYVNDEKVVRWLFDFLLEETDRLSQTCAEIIRHMSDLNRDLVLPFIDDLVDALDSNRHDAVKRCIFRMFQYATFNENQSGRVVDIAFRHLQNRSNAIAIRVFAMTTIYNVSKIYPALYDELVASISENLNEESAGFKNRAGKIINRKWK